MRRYSSREAVKRVLHGTDSPSERLKPARHESRYTAATFAFATLSVISYSLPDSVLPLWIAWVLTLAFVIAAVASVIGALSRVTFDRDRDTKEGSPNSNIDRVFWPIDELSTAIFITAATQPQRLYVRIKESVQQLSRAYSVKTKYTIRIPSPAISELDGEEPQTIYVPVVLARKGVLHDDLSVTCAGEEVPTLSFEASLCVAEDVLTTVASDGFSDYLSFDRYLTIQGQLVKLMGLRRNLDPTAKFDPEKETLLRLRRARKARRRIFESVPDNDVAEKLASIVTLLATNYFIIAALPASSCPPGGWVVIETSERAILKAVEDGAVHASLGLARVLAIARSKLQRLYGVRPNRLEYPVTKALRTGSYHLEIMGSEGTYLVRQRMESTNFEASYRRFRARRGQRYMHLYLRDLRHREMAGVEGHAFLDEPPRVVGHFAERMPGSYAPSSITSAAAVLVLFIASRSPQGIGVDLMALLLVAPGAIIGWSGFATYAQPTVGASVLPRFSAGITIILSVLGILQFSLASGNNALFFTDSKAAFTVAWSALVCVAAINAILISLAWLKEAVLHMSFADEDISELVSPIRR